MHKNLSELLEKEMTRKEFMATLGLGAASIMGLGTIIKLTTGKSLGGSHHVSAGYGGGVYGGIKKTA